MNPEIAKKLAEMGDVKGNAEKLRVAIEKAKANPDHPDSVELRRRLERGMFNMELQALGKKPFPVQQPKINLGAAMAAAKPQMVEGASVQSKVPTAPQKTGIMETVQDVGQTFMGVGGALRKGAEKSGEIMHDKDFNLVQKGFGVLGAGAGAISSAIGETITGIGKLGLTQESENKIKDIVQNVGQTLSETQAMRMASDWYDQLDKDEKLIVDSAGGMFSFMTDVLGFGAGSAIKKPVIEGVETAVDMTRQAAKQVPEVVPNLVPKTSGISESIVANINRINPTDRQKFQMQQGQSVESWLVDRGYRGTRDDTLKKLSDDFVALRENVDEALDSIPGTYRDNRVTVVADEAAEYAKSTEGADAGRMNELANKARGVGLTPKEINEVKRYYERNIKTGYLQDPTKTAEATAKATNRDSALREFLFEVADKNGFSNLREINKEIQARKFLADKIAGKMEGQGANNQMSITDWIIASPGLTQDPTFLAGFAAKKIFSTERVRSAAARVLSAMRPVKPLPRADLDDIRKRAAEVMKKQEDLRTETEQMALMADELQKSGYTMGVGKNPFITEQPIPMTRHEQALLRAAQDKEEYERILRYILDQKEQGNAVGEGFVIVNMDNTPILNPSSRLDPYKNKSIIKDLREGAISEIKDMLSYGEAGLKKTDTGYARFTSYPDWLPREYRSQILIDKVMKHFEQGTKPRSNATTEIELYELIERKINERTKQLRKQDMQVETTPTDEAF